MHVMTFAPQSLLDLRAYLKPITGLPDNDLGIVGDKFHKGGYHHGKSMLVSNDYSARTARDKAGLTEAASAFDLGMFSQLRELSIWCVRQCQGGHPDTLDIREIVYSPDGQAVWRWDREKGNEPFISGDPSHKTHSHFSYYRDSEKRDKRPLFRRFFERNDMTPQETQWLKDLHWAFFASDTGQSRPPSTISREVYETWDGVNILKARPPVTAAPVDQAAINAAVAAAMSDPAVLAKIAKAVTDEIGS